MTHARTIHPGRCEAAGMSMTVKSSNRAVHAEILNPAAAHDTDSVTVTRATAARYQLASMQGGTK